MHDDQGRALIFHGVNDDNCAKYHHLPCADREMIEREADAGFNFVRYLTSWLSIEPEQGSYRNLPPLGAALPRGLATGF